MKFSIRFLLALIVLAALGVNGWRMNRRVRQMDAEINQLEQVARDRRVRLDAFDRRQVIYARFFAADQLRAEQFANAEASFERLVQKYGQFKTPVGEQFKIVTVPTYDTSEYVLQSHRIYVPEQAPLELRVEFVDEQRHPLDSARLFKPAKPKTLALSPGEAVISFRWYRQADHHGTVEIDGQEVFAFQFKQPVSGYGSSSATMSRAHTSQLERPLEIITFTPGAGSEGIRLSIARQTGGVAP